MMKKYLFVLMALLLAIVAYADDMGRTPTPPDFVNAYPKIRR